MSTWRSDCRTGRRAATPPPQKYPAVKEDRLPHTLGRNVSGVVEKCGAPATAFKVGDEVFGMVSINGGRYVEKVVLDQCRGLARGSN
ncbi:hypothetical protein GCM10007874_26440 [Labrys miyagiensis]|uniref:Alcohol dehydrogenase-like N-terminal domain-containing protein n=1 Tax=Labrys miyagiensis TaxID=346912 RepID=A0ABQ6CJ26_9HYPH|nr:alcohol dehydrogenase catalytic domain-containing protein [Labrys miyagiensis]GLS19627.1 hypothetical protein GCM10007874_26440 [Labrys miyagiensis]